MSKTFKKIKDSSIQAKLDKILGQPVGTPIHLTREEAIAIVEAGRGGRPDLPPGVEYVRQVSKIWRWMTPDE
jgi:hypothetical protein